jgi:starvation-inducible DNA-binding protein
MACEKHLQNLIHDNFAVFYKSQSYHINVVGPDFAQYHDLFSEVYEYLYEWHDTLSEQLRQMDVFVDPKFKSIVDGTIIDEPIMGTGLDMMSDLVPDLDTLIKSGQALYDEAGKEGKGALETLIGDYMTGVSKLRWKLKATVK